MNTKYPKLTRRPCHKCGKFLLLVGEEIEKVDGQQFPVTTCTYICSDPVCQEDSNKKNAMHKQQIVQQEFKKQQRLDNIKKSRADKAAKKVTKSINV